MWTCVKKGAEWDYAKCGALDVLIFTYEKKKQIDLGACYMFRDQTNVLRNGRVVH